VGLLLLFLAPTGAAAQEDDSGGDNSAVPVAIDPCQLVTSAEASALSGASYTNGIEEPTGTGGQLCVYGSQTTNVFMVLVGQASDAATAQASWAQYEGEAQSAVQKGLPPDVSVNLLVNDASLQGFDRSALAGGSGSIGGRTINGSAAYLLKGPTFVSFSDLVLDQPAPSMDAMATQAETVLGRLP
jgi:hypothetical protein